MVVVELTAHPVTAEPVPERVSVQVDWDPTRRRLTLGYHLAGQVDRIRLPAPASAVQTDGLWRHSCCEAFVGREGARDYGEFNFSPSGQWAAYGFSDRRSGMREPERLEAPGIRLTREADELILEARADLAWLAPAEPARFVLGLAVVVLDVADRLSYWALRHPPGQPDFHDPSTFLLHLQMSAAQPSREPAT